MMFNFNALENMANYSAALYIRLSKEDLNQGESESITNQRAMLREYCKSNGIYVHDTYIDDGFSGTNFDRPDFKRMLEDIESKDVNLVITKDMSRLGRDHILVGHYMERYFPDNQVRYIAVLDGVDTGLDLSSNDMAPIRAVFNDMYARDTSKKVRATKRNKRNQGLFIGSKPSYGYKFAPNTTDYLVINEEVAHNVREIFARTIAGESARKIAKDLAERKIETPGDYLKRTRGELVLKPKRWTSEAITSMVRHQVYMGDLVQGKFVKPSYKSNKLVRVPKENQVIVRDTHEGIVTREEFEQANRMMDTRKVTRVRTHEYLLKGIVRCKECGKVLIVSNKPHRDGTFHYYFQCRTYARFADNYNCTSHGITEKSLTAEVIRLVRERCEQYLTPALSEKVIEEVIREVEQENSTNKELARLIEEVEKISRQMSIMYQDRLNGLLDDADFSTFYKELKDQRTVKEKRIKQLGLLQQQDVVTIKNLNALTEQFLDMADTNRELLVSLVDKVEFSDEREVFVHFRFGGVASAKIPKVPPPVRQKKNQDPVLIN